MPHLKNGQSLTVMWFLLVAATWVGCGGSDSTETDVVPPPTPSVVTGEPDNGDPPGGMELPRDAEIPPTPSTPNDASSGIQMPANIDVPIDQEASAAPAIQYATWEQIHLAAKSSGQITVVDLWSLACEPCLKEFPGLVRLHQSLGDVVQCIGVDVDFYGSKRRPPEHYESQVVAFLKSVEAAGFPNYICQTANEDVFAAVEVPSIPAVLVYDAQGEIVKIFVYDGNNLEFTYEKDVIPLVNELVNAV